MEKGKVLFLSLVLFALVLVLVNGCTTLGGGDGGGVSGYFPAGVGYTWEYSNSDGSTRIVTAEGTDVIMGDITVWLFSECELDVTGEVTDSDQYYYRITDSGVTYHGSPSSPIDPGIPFLEFPLSVGNSWVIFSYGQITSTATVTDSGSVSVPAGTFDCYGVTFVTTTGTIETSSYTMWFGDGVGEVKTVDNISPGGSELVWKNF